VDPRQGGTTAERRPRAGFLAVEIGQKRQDPVVSLELEAARGLGVWQLHLTSVPAGGSCPQQAFRAIRVASRLSDRLHPGSPSHRRMAERKQH